MSQTPQSFRRYNIEGRGIVERPRLLQKLRHAWEHKLTLISAPPGYGKTTLAAQFADQIAPDQVAWHTVEERERDLPNLFAQSIAALSAIVPEIEALARATYSSSELAVLIADFLRQRLSRDIIYVLDDVQNIAGAPAAEAWLRTLVAQVPANCHIVLISRILPDLPLVEMIARREVLAIGQEELRLNLPEIHEVAHRVSGIMPSAEVVEGLAKRLEGWPAGTLLALQPLPSDLERAMLGGGEGPEALFDALAELMLEAQPPGIREFLLASSTLRFLSPEYCAAILELPNSAELLAEVQVRNLFVVRASGGLVYHTLFRTFLQRSLKLHAPHQFVELHLKAARWFERNDRVEEAFEHYLAAGQIEECVAIAERAAWAFFTQGKVETLLMWSQQLHKLNAESPRLYYRCAMIYTDRYEYDNAENELNEAQRTFARCGDKVGLTEVAVQKAMILLQRGQYREAIVRAEGLLQNGYEGPNLHGRALFVLGMSRLRLGEGETALQHFVEGLPLYRANGDAYALSQFLQSMGMTYSRLGRLGDASACLQEVVALRRSLGSTSALATALNNLGYYYHRGSNYKQALTTLQEGLSLLTRFPNRRSETYLLWSLGDLKRDCGEFAEATQLYYRALERLGGGDPVLRCSILTSLSTLKRWQGQLTDAISTASEARALAQTHNSALEVQLAQAALSMARMQLGPTGDELARLEACAVALHEMSARFELVYVLGLCAHGALLSGDRATAARYLREANGLAEQVGSAQMLAAEVLRHASLAGIVNRSSEKFRALYRDLKALREAQARPIPQRQTISKLVADTTYSLRVTTLGTERLTRNGKLVPRSEWMAYAARALFYFLLFNGPTSREQIGSYFWPEFKTKNVRQNFHMTVLRARHAVGENAILFDRIENRYLINPEVDVWCDALEMESLCIQARLLSPRDARTEDLWRRAAGLYQGELLPQLYTDWIAPRRAALHENYIEALIGLGACARARGDVREALEWYNHARQLEPFREDIHRAIMICYADKGDKQKVVAHLQELQRLLHQELDAEPSSETLALAETLLG